jgi:hypothetical protein
MATVDRPGLACVEEGGQNCSSIDFEFGCQGDTSTIPYCGTEPAKGTAGFDDPGVDLIVYVHGLGQGVAKIHKLLNGV